MQMQRRRTIIFFSKRPKMFREKFTAQSRKNRLKRLDLAFQGAMTLVASFCSRFPVFSAFSSFLFFPPKIFLRPFFLSRLGFSLLFLGAAAQAGAAQVLQRRRSLRDLTTWTATEVAEKLNEDTFGRLAQRRLTRDSDTEFF